MVRSCAVGSQPCQPVDSRCKIPTPTAVRPAAAASQPRVLLRIDRRWAALHNPESRLCIRTRPCAEQDVAHLHGSETLCWQTLFTPPHFNPILSTQLCWTGQGSYPSVFSPASCQHVSLQAWQAARMLPQFSPPPPTPEWILSVYLLQYQPYPSTLCTMVDTALERGCRLVCAHDLHSVSTIQLPPDTVIPYAICRLR